MASAQTNIDLSSNTAATATGGLLVNLVSLPQEVFEATLSNLALAFPGESVLVATPDTAPQLSADSPLRLIPYTPTTVSSAPWILTAADYLNTFKLAQENRAATCLLLGAESQSLQPEAIRAFAKSALTVDLTVAHYDLGPREGLVNSAILYPVTRALFGTRPRLPSRHRPRPLTPHGRASRRHRAALHRRLAGRLPPLASQPKPPPPTSPSPKSTSAPAPYLSPLHPTQQPPRPHRRLPLRRHRHQSHLLAARPRHPAHAAHPPQTAPCRRATPDIAPMLDAFRLAYTNLHEIWSLVLPPNSLLGLKKLSVLPPENFRMPDNLWARIVYDFILAYRLRTINRGHLLGALTPLYLAWVASHLTLIHSGTAPEQHIEDLAAAFETEKPYLVSRWRWPDRFNP